MSDDNLKGNYELVGRALNDDVLPTLANFVGQTLGKYYRADWWKRGVLEVLTPDQRRGLPREGNFEIFTEAMDVQLCRTVINHKDNWRNVFQHKLNDNQRAWLNELNAIRNDWAHNKTSKFTDKYTERALDTMILLCDTLDKKIGDKLRTQLKKFQAQDTPPVNYFDDDDDEEDESFFQPEGDNRSWRNVMQPNIDVQEGTYKVSEFAADLAQVAAGTSKLSEYRDATEFFKRTYMTIGMRRLLTEAIDRLVHGNGDPIIEVKTSFGGGKTHSMMALYHLFNRKYDPLKIDKSVQELLLDAQIREFPKDICIAVAVGTDLNTERAKDIPELEGVQVHTFMGEVCSQLARAADRFDLYQQYIQLNDERKTSPGVKDLREFLDGCGACLILIDELVTYGKKLYNGENIEGGKFDQFIAFLQELSEAVKTSDRSILVASLPQSEIEIGIDDGGKEVLRTIEHHLGRLQSVWSPVEAHESFEIVRRRLFQPCRQEKLRDEICAEFAAMYHRGKQTFPISTREARYVNRIKACYPIHPQLFDLLYERWATIETFQKTRGVLRLMAEIVHKLWTYQDRNPIIMAGSIPLYEADVRNELTRYLPSNWTAIIDSEIDGKDSEPRRLEDTEPKLRLQTARRLTRTIFMGSAPTARGQNVRGLDLKEIMLGVLMPDDYKEASKFKDMLGTLKSKLTFLYSNETHSWFDNRPTLRKVAEQLEQNISADDVRYELVERLNTDIAISGLFCAKYVTSEPSKVPDDMSVRLVVLPPDIPYSGRMKDIFTVTEKILSQVRDGVIRQNKNALIFLAGDKAGLDSLKKLERRLLAWTRLSNEREERNLDQKQIEEVEKNVSELEKGVKTQIMMAYIYLIEPTVRPENMKEIEWTAIKLNVSDGELIDALDKRLKTFESVLWELSADSLERELDKHLFNQAPHVTLNRLSEYFGQYIYAPRLYDRKVLLDAVRSGVRDGVFGLAERFEEQSGEYIDLEIGHEVTLRSLDQLLVRRDEAEAQLRAENPIDDETTVEPEIEEILIEDETVEPDPTRFSVTFDVGIERAPRDVERCMEEIVEILMSLDRAEVDLKLVIESRVPGGIPEPEREALAQNCKQLKAKNIRFDL